MSLALTLRFAWRALWAHRFRSLLTMVSVIIGVAALVATLAIGKGANQEMQAVMDSLGKDTIYVFGGSRSRGGVRGGMKQRVRLTPSDWRVLEQLSALKGVAPCIWGDVQLVHGTANWGCEFTGTSPEYLTIMGSVIERGRAFTEDDVRGSAMVVLLGVVPARKLFGVEDPVGKTIRIAQFPFTVIGTLEEKGQQTWRSDDQQVLLPYTTAQLRLNNTPDFDNFLCQARRSDQLEAAVVKIKETLMAKNNCLPQDEDAYYVSSTARWFKSRLEAGKTFTAFTTITAVISLLVGGLGITNTMMMAVTERTREIGLRSALGARARDIHMQFLTESLVLSGTGGVLGVVLGMLLSWQAAQYAAWNLILSPWAILLCVGAAMVLGVVAGFYPAWRAAALDPVEALRAD